MRRLAGPIVVALALLPGCASNTGDSTGRVEADSGTPIEDAAAECGVSAGVSDEGETIFLDMLGGESGSGMVTLEDTVCVLVHLDVPSYVTTLMDQTRAMDGRQQESWDGYTASWSYHPDQGLDVLVRAGD